MLFLLSLATPIYSWANESILNRGPFLESLEAFRVRSGHIILFKAKASQGVKLCNYFNMQFLNPLIAEWALRALLDFTLSNARRFYSSMENPLDGKGLITYEKSGFTE